jgi:glycyl-tRNA synthetase beta chain
MADASLLVELNTEELPPKALQPLSAAFATGIENGLRARGFLAAESRATAFGAPRRLAVHLTQVAARSPDAPFRQKLVPVAIGLDAQGNATPALLKKLAALGANVDHRQLAREHDGKQDVLVYAGVRPGVALADGLQQALDDAIAALPIPKVMNYQLADGTTTVQFVRPAHRLVALHGEAVVPVRALGLAAGRETFGHRFHSAGPIAIASADSYAAQLEREGRVIASFEARRARIAELVTGAARRLDAQPLMPPALLDEVTALVEWPVVYASEFEAEFLAVPPECLILTMQQHQKYFALRDASGRLMNRFLLVSHLEAADGGAAIVAGNARVVRARLADAKFFFDQDRKRTLESRLPLLASVIYHAKLGSQLERVERLTGIAVEIAKMLGVDRTHVERAARLAKADLRTDMVGEFPELQGLMGRYYAQHDGEPADVATAIEEHYRPRFADDALPSTPVGLCVALADKLETLVGLFGIGEKPTGDRDPFALRRHAIGVLRMLIEKRLPLDVTKLLEIARDWHESDAPLRAWAEAYEPILRAQKAAEAKGGLSAVAIGYTKRRLQPDVIRALLEFLYDRLRGLLREQGYSANEVESVVTPGPRRLDDIVDRLAAVRAFMQLPEAESLAAANKRIGNILKKSAGAAASVDPALLFEPAEKALAAAFAEAAPRAQRQFDAGNFTEALRALAPLKRPVDQFFDDVMVNVDDEKLRANRLALLAQLRAQMNRVADLALLAAG